MRRRKSKRRGISLGTVVMLVLTLCVATGLSLVLPKLNGSTDMSGYTGKVLDVLSISGSLPELTLADIPLSAPATTEPSAQTSVQPDVTVAPTLQPEMMATPTPAVSSGSFTVTIGGSIAMDNEVRKSAYVSEAETYDFSEMLSLLAPEMQSDLAMVTLENLIDPTAKLSDTVTTEQVLDMLASTGIDAVALGFKKAYDQGMTGLANTINALTGRGITVLGAFSDAGEAATMKLMTLGGVKVALLHYTDALSSAGRKKIKSEDTAYAIPLCDEAAMLADMDRAREAGAQVIIVSLNWGEDNKKSPTKAQTALAQTLADGGADVIVGAGNLAVQNAVWLTGKRVDGSAKQTLCCYSLGNLITAGRTNANVAGMLLQLRIAVDGNGEVIFEQTAYTPTYIWKYKQDGQVHFRVIPSDAERPDAMSDEQYTAMTRTLTTLSNALADSPVTQR